MNDVLTFGVNDGDFSDNSGQFNIDVFQVEAATAPVPEPTSLTLFGAGVVTAAGCRVLRRRRAVFKT